MTRNSALFGPVFKMRCVLALLKWHNRKSSLEITCAGDSSPSKAPADPTGGTSLFTAMREQLGLKLEGTKAPWEILVIDRVERPSEN
jgi:uncharacterized protein (TIGR03435 family)